ncbi:MAG: CBS domain-containing protein [Polaromonas sp.]|nr:CBS domain-containing protein [Polaromonas sp.]
MATVKNCIDQKSANIISLTSTDSVFDALELMKSNKVRSIMIIESGVLKGIVTQGDCAIKVLLPGWNAKQTLLSGIMTKNPVTVGLADLLDTCMNTMASRNLRHLPVVEAGKVLGMVSIGDIVKDIIRQQGDQIKQLETFIKGHGVA